MLLSKGGSFKLDSSTLQVYDADSYEEDITYQVLSPPTWGVIVNAINKSIPINNFSIDNLSNGDIMYQHNNLSQSTSDSFDLKVSNGVVNYNITFLITILSEESNDTYPVLDSLRPLVIEEQDGSLNVITSDHLSIRDDTLQPRDMAFTIMESSGKLLLDGKDIVNKTFTQKDIDENLITFESDGTSLTYRIVLRMNSKKGNSYLYDHKVTNRNIIFTIAVKPKLTKEPMVHITAPRNVEVVWNRHQGYRLTSAQLHAEHSSFIPSQLHYYIVHHPQHGHVFNVKTEKAVRTFTQADVNSNNVVLILKQSSETRDFFTFHIATGQVTFNKEYRMDLQWPIVFFAASEYSVCEDIGTLNISIHRHGNRNVSTYVGIMAIGLTAHESLDFVVSPTRRLLFEPGISNIHWPMKIVQDNSEEVLIEQVRVLLFDPENCLIGFHNQTLVNIYDGDKSSCSLIASNSGKTKQVAKKLPFDSDEDNFDYENKEDIEKVITICNQNIVGLLQYNQSTGILYECNGKEWVVWKPTAKVDLSPNENDVEWFPPTTASTTSATRVAAVEKNHRRNHSSASKCPQGWHYFAGDCHKFQRHQNMWSAARGACERHRNSDLVVVKSAKHNAWLVQLARNKPFWIGLHASSRREEWVYKKSNLPKYTNWKKGFPRLPSSGEMKHKCVLVRGSGLWINRHCNYHDHSFICTHAANTGAN